MPHMLKFNSVSFLMYIYLELREDYDFTANREISDLNIIYCFEALRSRFFTPYVTVVGALFVYFFLPDE